MSSPAQNWTTVATTRISGISQSMVSRCSGRYITPISARPVVRATCQLALETGDLGSRRGVRARRRLAVAAGSPATSGVGIRGARGGGVPGLGDRGGQLVRRCGGRVVERPGAVSVARLTETSTTPSTRDRALWTRPTHDAQVMPPMSKLDSVARPGRPGGRSFRRGGGGRGHRGAPRAVVGAGGQQASCVAGLVDRGGDLVAGERPVAGHGHVAGGELDVDVGDAGEGADLLAARRGRSGRRSCR